MFESEISQGEVRLHGGSKLGLTDKVFKQIGTGTPHESTVESKMCVTSVTALQ